MTQAEWARNPVGYMSKYASKPAEFPGDGYHTTGARWWGCGGLPPGGRDRLRFTLAPAWVQRIAEAMDCDKVKRITWEWTKGRIRRKIAVFGWWRIGAYEFRSPWRCVGFGPEGATVEWRGWGEHDFCLAGAA
jgi:hypothetical protein